MSIALVSCALCFVSCVSPPFHPNPLPILQIFCGVTTMLFSLVLGAFLLLNVSQVPGWPAATGGMYHQPRQRERSQPRREAPSVHPPPLLQLCSLVLPPTSLPIPSRSRACHPWCTTASISSSGLPALLPSATCSAGTPTSHPTRAACSAQSPSAGSPGESCCHAELLKDARGFCRCTAPEHVYLTLQVPFHRRRGAGRHGPACWCRAFHRKACQRREPCRQARRHSGWHGFPARHHLGRGDSSLTASILAQQT